MSPKSAVLFPPADLASCVSLAVVRDTRNTTLSDADRLNYFPATPLIALTIVMQGQLHVSSEICDLASLRHKEPARPITVTPPQTTPTQSWSNGPVHAITIGIYPDAWQALGGDVSTNHLPDQIAKAAEQFLNTKDPENTWPAFCAALQHLWGERRAAQPTAQWPGSHRVADWARHLLTRVALSGPGQSARSFERRMKRWTGQSRQALTAFAQLETLYSLHLQDPEAPLAAMAADAQFSDQSHMGRAVKKATGFPPARLNQLIETQEAFWCYRLLGERL